MKEGSPSNSTWEGIIKAYRAYLPITEKTPIVTLREGNTPLLRTENLSKAINPRMDLYLKVDGVNPTGSFKDRGMTLAMSKAMEGGAQAVLCASTGNTSASAAAYGARAGIKVHVVIPEGKIAVGKLAQAIIHRANVIQIDGNFDQALGLVKEIAARYPLEIVNSINPYRLEGQKTVAFEICDQLGSSPEYHFLPVGNAGNITATWKGYHEFHQEGRIPTLPRMMGIQASGAAPMVLGRIVDLPKTLASAIRIGNPANWEAATQALKQSKGEINSVTDDEIVEAYRMIAGLEGVFCEPASAASVAGVIQANKKGLFRDGDVVVCTLTGHGLKDPETAIRVMEEPVSVKAELGSIIRALGIQ